MIIYDQLIKKYGFSLTQQEIIRMVGKDKIVLEIGSSTGYMTKVFLDNGCTVDIVERDKAAVPKIPRDARKVINGSIEDPAIYKLLGDFDFIIMADVLEHLVDPEQVLKRLFVIASPHTKLIISLPNVACWAMRKQLFFNGNFEYQESGLLDKTHLHFYTVDTLPKILTSAGWQVEKIVGTVTRLPLEGLISRIPFIRWIFYSILYNLLVDKYKNLAYCHFIVAASKNEKD